MLSFSEVSAGDFVKLSDIMEFSTSWVNSRLSVEGDVVKNAARSVEMRMTIFCVSAIQLSLSKCPLLFIHFRRLFV